MASVQEQILGNCLCPLGDAMAMPIGSMIAKFRSELEGRSSQRAILRATCRLAQPVGRRTSSITSTVLRTLSTPMNAR